MSFHHYLSDLSIKGFIVHKILDLEVAKLMCILLTTITILMFMMELFQVT